MKFRVLATVMAVLASAHTARAQALFPPETDNAALRYWFALAEVQALRTMQRATKLPACNWGFDYRNGGTIPLWFGMRVRLLSHLNELQGIREMAHGDSRTAVETWLAGVHFGQDVSRSGPVIAALIAHAIILDNLDPLRDSARQRKLNEEQKRSCL